MHFRELIPALVFSLLAGCGGSDSDSNSVQQVELSASAKQSLSGDWPISGFNHYYLAQDQLNWQAIWSERLSRIDCSQSFNFFACNQITPPEIDFSRYMLIGIYLDRYGHFVGLPGTLAANQVDGALFVTFTASVQSLPVAPLSAAPESVFFLIPHGGKPFNPVTFSPASGV